MAEGEELKGVGERPQLGRRRLKLASKADPSFAVLADRSGIPETAVQLLAVVPFLHLRRAVSGKCNREQVLGKRLDREASGA